MSTICSDGHTSWQSAQSCSYKAFLGTGSPQLYCSLTSGTTRRLGEGQRWKRFSSNQHILSQCCDWRRPPGCAGTAHVVLTCHHFRNAGTSYYKPPQRDDGTGSSSNDFCRHARLEIDSSICQRIAS